jgi:hypothetical protein
MLKCEHVFVPLSFPLRKDYQDPKMGAESRNKHFECGHVQRSSFLRVSQPLLRVLLEVWKLLT